VHLIEGRIDEGLMIEGRIDEGSMIEGLAAGS
jgi:hypothetical protein